MFKDHIKTKGEFLENCFEIIYIKLSAFHLH